MLLKDALAGIDRKAVTGEKQGKHIV